MKFFAAACLVGASAVHPDRAAQIELINNSPGVTWRAASHERFEEKAPGASKSLCGLKPGWRASLEEAVRKGEVKAVKQQQNRLQAGILPEEFDSAQQWPHCADMITDIRDQSNCGCCWAFAGAEAASDRMCIATDGAAKLPLSTEDVCFCGSDDGCNGGFIQESWMYIRETGAVTGGQYSGTGAFGNGFCSAFSLPHCHHHGPQGEDPYPAEGEDGCPSASSPQCPTKCDADTGNEHSDFTADKYSFRGDIVSAEGEEGIMQALLEGGPMEVAFTVYSDFEDYAGGIYQHVTGEEAGGHAVKMVGWGVEDGVKYWKIANSKNPYWGEKGHFRILRGSNECGIEDKAAAAAANAQWGKVADLPPYVPKCEDSGILDCEKMSSMCSTFAPACLNTCGCCVDDPPAFCSQTATIV